MYLGIDIGSSSSKAVLLADTGDILWQGVASLGAGTGGVNQLLEHLYGDTGVRPDKTKFSVVTGYGRMTYPWADLQITEISCHAKGVLWLLPGTRTVIDIGGQDAKAIRLNENGSVENFMMNEKCAAGTGRFLEVMARVLGCSIAELSILAERSTEELQISNVCTVFAESEVISQLAAGKQAENVAWGALRAIARRVSGQAARVHVVPAVAMTGGAALNQSLVRALSMELNMPIEVPENPQTVGALGAALFAREKHLAQVSQRRETEERLS